MAIINSIISLGASVMMPIIFFIVGLIFKMKPAKAFKAGMLVGVGFTGVSMVINLLLNALGPASKAMVARLGLHLTVTDVGWATASTIGWGSPIMPVAVVGFLVINAILLVLNVTKTVDIDIFNFWIFLLLGAVIYAGTNNFWVAVVADLTQPIIQKQFPNKDLKGISFPHLTCIAWIPFGIAADWIIEKIPGLNKINLQPEAVNKRLGTLGEPISFGAIIGVILGILAGYDVSKVVTLGINIAAAMYLLPIMVDVLVSGLVMVRDRVDAQLKEWFPKRKFFIGMDTALLIDDPSVLATGLLLLPFAIILAFVLPGNKVLPFADLASLMFLFALVAPFCKRNMFRMLIAGILIVTVVFYAGTSIAPEFTKAAVMSNIGSVKSFTAITNIVGSATTWIGWIFIKLAELVQGMF
ncbi:PTS galactitol transporter subunit IIC [Companilactobacillus muriivasis]|uniref:PTS galactitol transporter subunit IIC n=1 Tax=Companilactobacillus muriivasis TaxID=3081444 RepID=UPI0030C67612